VHPLRATVDVHIHYSIEVAGASTRVSRWLLLDIDIAAILRPLCPLITTRFDKENVRTMAVLASYASAHAGGPVGDYRAGDAWLSTASRVCGTGQRNVCHTRCADLSGQPW
jgi:hypothetical protein